MERMHEKPHVLFVCGRNQWRSPTAARVYAGDQRMDVRSAGLGSQSRRQVTDRDVVWADLILVMEQKHRRRFRTHPHNDVAAKSGPAQCLPMDLAPPPPGDRVVGFGYHSSSGGVFLGSDGERHVEVNALGAATVGEVRAVHSQKRDSCRLAFPCYRLNARFDGGMGGGPIINDRGRLCGVVCSNLPPSDLDSEHVSYAATLWPLMAIPVSIDLNGHPCEKPHPLLDLAREGVIQATGWESIEIAPAGEQRTTVRWRCVGWI